jgi:hypothetical protein
MSNNPKEAQGWLRIGSVDLLMIIGNWDPPSLEEPRHTFIFYAGSTLSLDIKVLGLSPCNFD